MGFLQIIDFHTDRDHPGHHVALDWFTDYGSAMASSTLPAMEVFVQGVPELRRACESNDLAAYAFAEDVELDIVVTRGLDALVSAMRDETPARRLKVWDAETQRQISESTGELAGHRS